MITGITIELGTKTEVGADSFNRPVYSWTYEDVDDVLVGQPDAQQAVDTLNMTGRRVDYLLAIPKGDEHTWEGGRVVLPSPFAGTYDVIGIPTAGIDDNIPLSWNMKVKVSRHE